jgi:hypothetical protein
VVDENFAELLAFVAKTRRCGRVCRMRCSPAHRVVHRVPSRAGRALGTALLGAVLALASGCGNTLYAVQMNAASSKLEEAKELGAERYAPYEYWFAYEHIQKAESEASEADYGDAVELAGVAETYADKAIKLAREAHRGAGR